MMEGRISRPDLAHGPRIVKLGALSQVECHQCEQGEIIKKKKSHDDLITISCSLWSGEGAAEEAQKVVFFFFRSRMTFQALFNDVPAQV